MSKFKYDRKSIIENIDDVLIQGDLKTFQEAKEWYNTARNIGIHLSDKYNINPIVVFGLISCLSPQKSWHHNLLLTEEFLQSEGKDCRQTKSNVDKAIRIYNLNDSFNKVDSIKSILKGGKTISFFLHIFNPNDDEIVVLDSHMMQLLTGNFDKKVATKNEYEFLKNIIIEKAKQENMLPSVLQSFLWLLFRKIKKEKLGNRVRLS